MKIVTTPFEMQQCAREIHARGETIACVPTMGYLPEGQLSIVARAHPEADRVVLTLSVNPIQFGPNEDYAIYPRDAARDTALCEERGVDILFMPSVADMYAPDASVRVDESSLSKHLCGKVRPGHFNGVCTVVTKLFNATMADVAIFGQKDAQQVAVIRRMVRDLNVPIRIVASPIVREADGLAMSSRNTRRSPEERKNALGLSRSLRKAAAAYTDGERSADAIRAIMKAEMEASGLRVDYASAVDGDSLEDVSELKAGDLLAVAAYSGETRLIDNAVL